jgi:hypothetical protein
VVAVEVVADGLSEEFDAAPQIVTAAAIEIMAEVERPVKELVDAAAPSAPGAAGAGD